MKAVVLFFILTSVISCSPQINPADIGFVCTEHGTHRRHDPASFAACFGLVQTDLDNYRIFMKESDFIKKENLDSEIHRLQDRLADEMVSVIMTHMKQYFGEASLSYWTLERTTMPVTYRYFTHREGDGYSVKAFSIMLKTDLGARSLLRYLPLEYKMNFLQVKDNELQMADPKREFDPRKEFEPRNGLREP